MNLVPIDQNKSERPGRQNPPDRSAHAHQTKLTLSVFHVRERNRVGDRDRRHIQQAMDQHQAEEERERRVWIRLSGSQARHRGGSLDRGQPKQGQTADQLAESQKLLGGEMPVRVLIAEEHPHDGREWKGVQNQRLL